MIPFTLARRLAGILLVLALSACSFDGRDKAIPQVTDAALESFEETASMRPVELRSVLHELKIGQHIGALSWDIGCMQSKNMEWTDKIAGDMEGRYKSSFYHELERANGKRFDDPDAVFEKLDGEDTHIQVAGRIMDLAFNACGSIYLISFDAEAYIKMNWQVYDSAKDEIVHEVETQGVIRQDGVPRSDLEDLLFRAYESNVRQLIADPQFRRTLSTAL